MVIDDFRKKPAFWVTTEDVWRNSAFIDPKRWRKYQRELMKRIDEHIKKQRRQYAI